MRLSAFFLGFALTFCLLWAMWPAPIEPYAWEESEPPQMIGALTPNNALAAADIFRIENIPAGEGIAVGPNGEIYAGTANGNIQRLTRASEGDAWRVETLAHVGETPMIGLEMIDANTLGIASNTGLYALDINTLEISSLSTGVLSHPFGFVNDLAVTESGEIYFTDSSTRWGHRSDSPGYYYDMLENRPNGLVYVWDPRTRGTRIALNGLYYPNGITVASDGQSVFISETFRYQIQRLWIAGPRAGQTEIFADNLPGMPDGLSSDGDGRIFVAMLSQRSELLRQIHENPTLNLFLVKLPMWLRPNGGPTTAFITVHDEQSGDVIESFHDGDGGLSYISSVATTADGDIWFGSTYDSYVGRFRLPDSLRPTPGQQNSPGESVTAQDP
jgi:sugar lactone lactonase YvrE